MQPLAGTNTLLLVEDDPLYAEFLLSSIAKTALPFTLKHVSTLDQALSYVRGDSPYADRLLHPMPAVVLLDINLGGNSGFPLLRWLQEHGQLENEKIRVVMLTASDRAEDIHQGLKFGALSYVLKSPLPDSVINLLARLASRDTPHTQANMRPRTP